MGEPVIEVSDLSLRSSGGPILKDVNLRLERGEILGIVGESGSGKTLLTKSILGVLPDSVRRSAGTIRLWGEDSSTFSDERWRGLWAARFGAVFQDPGSFLNPSYTVFHHFAEFYRVHGTHPRRERRARALEALESVNIAQPHEVLDRYRHELSGGTLQRILIALALARSPEVLIADEATTALDVTVEAEVLDLIAELRDTRGMSIIVVSHDLAVVSRLADTIVVLQKGIIVEAGPARQLLTDPQSDYLKLLIDSYARYGIDGFRESLTAAPAV